MDDDLDDVPAVTCSRKMFKKMKDRKGKKKIITSLLKNKIFYCCEHQNWRCKCCWTIFKEFAMFTREIWHTYRVYRRYG